MRELQMIMGRLNLDWKVCPFGSFANGFGTVFSDLDVTCCQPRPQSGIDAQKDAALALGSWIIPLLQLHDSFSVVEEILGARVPILKLRFENQLDVDLSCHNPKPLLNTCLLKAYSEVDTRIKDLGLAVKVWSKRAGVCDATKKNLSSYAFSLLVIYFLQVHSEVSLPVLPAEAFEENGKPRNADEYIMLANRAWRCDLSLPELMVRFFAFYSSQEPGSFDWGSEVASIRLGRRRDSQDPLFAKLRGTHTRRLHVEDPYELQRNMHCVLGAVEEDQLRGAFSKAWCDMQAGNPPVGLRPSEELPDSLATPVTAPPLLLDPVLQGQAHASNALVELMRVYKETVAADSGTDSTKSGADGADSTKSKSDDESSSENVDRPDLGAIPLPLGLFNGLDKVGALLPPRMKQPTAVLGGTNGQAEEPVAQLPLPHNRRWAKSKKATQQKPKAWNGQAGLDGHMAFPHRWYGPPQRDPAFPSSSR
jgi:hypothetical protein